MPLEKAAVPVARPRTHSVSAVLNRPPFLRNERSIRVASAGLVVLAVAGLFATTPLVSTPAGASTPGATPITVTWAGDTSSASAYQPTRDTTSAHYGDFDDLSVTVSQTTGLIDQAVRVTVSGFAGTIGATQSINEVTADNAKNFVQAMQCWGPDPLAANFHETCQWGGRYGVEGNGLGDSVVSDVAARVSTINLAPGSPGDVPFRTVDAKTDEDPITGQQKLDAKTGTLYYELQSILSPSTTNEVTSARIGADGTGYFDFETQSSYQAPQLGCGTKDHLRCWLVIVPRGTHFGGDGVQCSQVLDKANGYEPYTKGQADAIQGGSPINPACDYWDNRMVVPIDFNPTGVTCAVGESETRVIGSQLMIGAMNSWQPSLCQTTKQTFSFATNPDSVARAQVLEDAPNSPVIAFSGYPVSAGELMYDSERDTLAKTKLTYTPVAVSSVVIAFYAETSAGRIEKLTVSPRLMAKLLTQSYKFQVPTNSSSTEKSSAHLGAVNRSYTYISSDPDFTQLNPAANGTFTSNPSVVLPGPSGADAIRQVWKWIFADDDAVAFMNGTPDPWGMTVNPYYLPKGAAGASVPWYYDANKDYVATPVTRPVGLADLEGAPMKLTEEALDTFPKIDETIVPFELGGGITSRFDSLQYAPYAETMLSAARQAFRADPASKARWDGSAINPAGDIGAWVSSGAQLPGQKFMIAITDSVSAQRYGLTAAAVQLPDSTSTVTPDDASMLAALSALTPTSLDVVKQVDPSRVMDGGYPMTIVTYAGVNLTKSTAAERTTLAAMLTQVTTTGQEKGPAVGQLPAGYVPLPESLVKLATVSILEISGYVPPKPGSTDNGYAVDDYNPESSLGGGGGDGLGPGSDPSLIGGVDELSGDRTLAALTEPMVRSGLAIALGVGLAGFLVGPVLIRGRGLL